MFVFRNKAKNGQIDGYPSISPPNGFYVESGAITHLLCSESVRSENRG